jgi:hypothetical protein
VTDLLDQLAGRPWRGHLNPFVAGRLRNLWPAAIFPNFKPKFEENPAAAAVIHRLTLRVFWLSAAAYE